MAHIKTIHDLVGKEVGVTPWIVIDQEKIDNHARNTGDDSWIHIDPDRAAKETPFGSTIAQGFLLLSVLPDMTKSLDITDGGCCLLRELWFRSGAHRAASDRGFSSTRAIRAQKGSVQGSPRVTRLSGHVHRDRRR